MNIVDLHVHSTKSDGSFTPAQLVDYALVKGLSAFALTDHDTTEGLDEAISYAKDKPIEVIPGIELSTEYKGRDIHIVGLYIDHHCSSFQQQIQQFRDARIYRNRKMCRNLQEAGIDITYEKLVAEFPDSVITRSHYAKYLLKYGYIKSLPEAFDRYVGDHCKYFVPREKITPTQAVSLILDAGGIPVLAHPVLYHMTNAQLDELTGSLKKAGLIGIEAIYSTYKPADERDIRRLAAKYDLAISGGSDFHGTAKPGLDLATGYGKLFIPEEILTGLKARLRKPRIFFTDLDGTLLNQEKKVTPKTLKAIDHWLSHGNILAISSGRPLASILEVIALNKIGYQPETDSYHENLYAIAFNGALTYHVASKTVIDREVLKPDEPGRIAEIARAHHIYCHTYDETHILAPAETEELAFYRRTVHLPYKILPDFPVSIKELPCKFLCICLELTEPDRLLEVAEDIRSAFPDTITCVKSSPYLLEVFSSASGKGSAVTKLCSYLTIPVSNSYAAGDEQNDISMLQAAGHGIAMANADASVQAAAEFVTEKTNNEDGLVPFFEE